MDAPTLPPAVPAPTPTKIWLPIVFVASFRVSLTDFKVSLNEFKISLFIEPVVFSESRVMLPISLLFKLLFPFVVLFTFYFLN